MSGENWLQKMIEVPALLSRLQEQHGLDGINAVCSGDRYQLAMATLAMGLSNGIDATGQTPRKRKRLTGPMLNKLLDALPAIYMLAYEHGRADEHADWMIGVAEEQRANAQ